MTYADIVQAGLAHVGAATPPRAARPAGPARLLADPAWFVDLGMVLLLLGIIASMGLLLAGDAPIRDTGLLMIVAGAAQVACALRVEASRRILPWVTSGTSYALAGALAFWTPAPASPTLGLLAFALALAGASRLLALRGVRLEAGPGWMLAIGLVTAPAGLLALAAWQIDAPGAAALVLVADLTVQGLAWLALGLKLDEDHPASAGGQADA